MHQKAGWDRQGCEDWGLGRGCPFVGQAAGGSSRGEGDEWLGGGGHSTLL